MKTSPVGEQPVDILIVDDTLPNLHLLRSMLINHGYTVHEATDGPGALASVQTRLPDIILLDIRLPGMDGYEVCKRLKADEHTRNVPVIFISALDDQRDKVQGFAVGGVDYITKPFQIKEVLARVETHLTLRTLQQQLEAQNAQLQQEVEERIRAELALQAANEQLERRVQERTADLVRANQVLNVELQERQRAEQALMESQRFIENIYAATPGIVYIFDIVEQKVILPNRRIGEILGHADHETNTLETKTDEEIPHPDDLPRIIEDILPRIMEELRDWETADDNQIRSNEYRIVDRLGNWHWLLAREKVFKRGPDGQVVQIVGTAYDITEQKQAEVDRELLWLRVREQAQQVQEIINSVPEGMVLLSDDGQVLLANPAAQDNLQVLAATANGNTLTHLGDRSLADLLDLPPGGTWHEIRSGSRIFEAITRPILSSSAPDQRWVMVIRDVTREREARYIAQQQERLAAVGQLAAGIAHDFNNILAVISLYADIALSTPELHPKLQERLQTIAEQAHHASDLIQQILDFSRRLVLERRHMDILPFIKEQTKLFERTLPENIQIVLQYQPGEYVVEADLTRMQQAIMNIVLNARDAMPDGGTLRISLDRTEPGATFQCLTCGDITSGEWVIVTIEDTGLGISAEDLPHIFEPFFTTKAPGHGTGLGLSQVYGIIKKHDGHISVQSAPGKGTILKLYLPMTTAEHVQPLEVDARISTPGQGQTILIVEDEPTTRQALAEGLTLLNYQVISAADGREALEYIRQNGSLVDLVLSDVVMPEMGGVALFRAMRALGLSTPVVMMTGHPLQQEMENLTAEGLAGWLLKPPSLKQLARIITQALM